MQMLETASTQTLAPSLMPDGIISRESGLRDYLEKYFALSAREEAIRNRRLYSIEIELTRKCNLECPYCYSDSSSSAQEHLDPDVVRRVLREGYEYGLRSVWWFGGEPILYPALFEVLDYARKLGYDSVLYTNGIALSPDVAKRLRQSVGTVAIHLDTLDRDVFQRIHFGKTKNVCDELHASILRSFDVACSVGFCSDDIRLTLTLSTPVVETLAELLDWAFSRFGLQTSIFIPLAPFGRAAEFGIDWYPTADQVERAYNLRATYEGRPYLRRLGVAEYCKQYQMTMCYLRADASVACYAGGQTCGDVRDQSFASLVSANYAELAFRRYSDGVKNFIGSGSCSHCEHSHYCFGNPVLANKRTECSFYASARRGPRSASSCPNPRR